jgi:hypothetical protein
MTSIIAEMSHADVSIIPIKISEHHCILFIDYKSCDPFIKSFMHCLMVLTISCIICNIPHETSFYADTKRHPEIKTKKT